MLSRDERFQVGTVPSVGLLLLRAATGLTMAIAHGYPKLERLMGDGPVQFADPFGIGMMPSLVMAIFGELVCGVLLAIGLGTRIAAVPFAITMIVAITIAHAGDPWSDKEHAFLFLVPAITLALTGPGRYSFDAWIADRRAVGRAR